VNDISSTVMIVLLAGLVVVVVIVVLSKKGVLSELNLEMLKGMFKLNTKSDQLAISEKTEEGKELQATKILKWLQEQINKVNGSYVLTDSTHENAKIAMQLYTKVTGEIIATCFFESPDYGIGDYAYGISPGTCFNRLTLRSLCNSDTESVVRERIKNFECKGNIIVIDDSVQLSKMGGIFCKMPDKSYLTFIALNSVSYSNRNQGLVFSGTLAQQLFDYYNSFIPNNT